MKGNKYLNEGFYRMGKKAVITIGIVVLLLGIGIGGFLLYKGFSNLNTVKAEWSDAGKQAKIDDLNTQYDSLKNSIQDELDQITALERVQFTGFDDAYYQREDQINALKESVLPVQEKMDDIKNQIDTINREDAHTGIEMESQKFIPFFIFGGFILIVTLMLSFSIFTVAFGREITAWGVQQAMPVAKEGIEDIAPTIGHASGEALKAMAPAYGSMSKEIAKGIKEGLSKDTKICSKCKTENSSDATYCKKCGKKL